MEVLVIGRVPPGFSGGLNHELTEVGCLAGSPADAQYDCVIINGSSLPDDLQALRDVRTNEALRLVPLYCCDEVAAQNPLADGQVRDGAGLETALNHWRTRSSRLKLEPSRDFEALVLSYLWVLPNRSLRPSRNAADPGIYAYDLLKLWDPGAERSWLDRSERLGLIETDTLVDRLRQCPHCDSAHLNYIDCCPSCSAIDISNDQSIHCFACGHVAEEARFLRHQKLICPNCNVALRHIGTDYDRPIETCQCNACRQRFVDAPVRAACLDCGRVSDPEDLKVRTIHTYRLAPEGEAVVRTGRQAPHRPVVYGEPMDPEHFKWVLKWLNDQAGADRAIVMAGLRLCMPEPNIGPSDAGRTQHVSEMIVQLQSLLAPSDVVTVYSDDIAFVIFATGGSSRLDGFVKDVKQIQTSQTKDEMEIVIAARALPDSGVAVDAAKWLEGFAAELRAHA
jgi:hypothetical protein